MKWLGPTCETLIPLSSSLQSVYFLSLPEGLMTEDGDLHAGQSPVAVYNNATQQFQAQLTCGTFIHQEQPPFNVLWTVSERRVCVCGGGGGGGW